MSVIGSNILAGASGQAVGYQVERSLRCNSADSAYLSRTPASAGNRKTWTWSGWVKKTEIISSGDRQIFGSDSSSGSEYNGLAFVSTNKLNFRFDDASGLQVRSTAVYRDASAWMHIVCAVDTTQATASNRIKLYVNGSQITDLDAASYPAQNAESSINSTQPHEIGRRAEDATSYFNGYLADIWFLDGIAATPSDFAETDATTGQWVPKTYSGSKGSNGFHLEFADNSNNTASTLGKDTSGNGNNWTPNNLSVTAGAGNDSFVDTPTSYGTDTGAGGEVRGNYCTLNPLSLGSGVALANGNLDVTLSTSNAGALGTIAMPSGKWYFEGTVGGTGNNVYIAIRNAANTAGYFYATSGLKADFSGAVAYGASSTTGDVLGVAFDNTAGTITFYKNGVSQGVAYSGISTTDTWFPYWYSNVAVSTAWSFNFGQRPFAYTAPSGFKALVDTNLPAPVVAQPNTVFDVVTYNGSSGTKTITMPGGFSPDLVWIKNRGQARWHSVFDQVRGVYKRLFTNATDAEANNVGYNLDSFTSTGFTLLDTDRDTNSSAGDAYVAWAWDAGSSTVTNTQGSITSSVRVNASSGFSVITWTGQTAAGSIGHGLGVAPSLIICKARSNAQSWGVYHKDVGINNYLLLDSTGASTAYSGIWGSTAPTSTVFSVPGNVGLNNNNGWTYVGYAFAPVAGYSSFGSYTGNGSSDGPFVYTGFRPRWILVKRSDSSTGPAYWIMWDSARKTYNLNDTYLLADQSQAEFSNTAVSIDILSNGFKLRNASANQNASGGTYIFAAFAENPFQFARAR